MFILKKNKFQIVTIVIFAFAIFLTGRGIYRTITTTAPDFSIFWLTASGLLKANETNPYLNPKLFTANPNPPHTHLFFLPLTLLPYQTAQGIFIFTSLVATIACVYLSLKMTTSKISWQSSLFVLSLTFLSFPTKFSLGMGQTNVIVLLLLLLSFYSYQRKKGMLAGITLGLAVSLKSIFIFFLLFFLLKRQWKILLWSIGIILTAIFLTVLITGSWLYNYWLTEAISPFLSLNGREVYYNQGFSGVISRFSRDLLIREHTTAIFSLLVLATTIKLGRQKKGETLQLSLFIVALTLIDTLSWQHHFVWLIFPFIVLTHHILKIKQKRLLWFLGLAYVLVSWNIKTPGSVTSFLAPLLLSHVFIGTLGLFLVNSYLLSRRQT